MHKLAFSVAVLAILVVGAPAEAQFTNIADTGIDLGVGMVLPLQQVILDGVITDGGNFRATHFVPNAPQFAVEFHRAFPVTNSFGVGPMFYSAVSFSSTGVGTVGPQPVSAGVGMAVTLYAPGSRTFNFGVAYGRANASAIVDSRLYIDGFPPADGATVVRKTSRSYGRLILTITVSGLFGG